jgi:hypothetical protein
MHCEFLRGGVHTESRWYCLSRILEVVPGPPTYSLAKVLSTTLDLSKRYLERHGNRIYVTGIPPLQAVLRLLVQDVDFLRDGSRLEIPSDSFFARGLNFVGALCSLGDTGLQLGESYYINLAKLELTRAQTALYHSYFDVIEPAYTKAAF